MNELAQELDQKALGLAGDFIRTEGLLLILLSEMAREKLFAILNYANIFDYCERRLKLSRSQAYYFKMIAEKTEEVPQIKEAVIQGDLTVSQARRIATVITPENHLEWFEKAKNLPQKTLEREVAAVNPRSHVQERIKPVARDIAELKVAVTLETENDIEALKEILSQKLGKAASLADVVAWAAKVTREKFDPLKIAERSKAISLRKPSPGRHPIPAGVKHPVTLRDGNRCTHVSTDGRRCEQRRWLQLHHQIEVENGGLNTVDNLKTLCRAHHSLNHPTNTSSLSRSRRRRG